MNSQILVQLLPLVALFAIMYFLLIRPQKKKEKQVNSMRNALKVGDEVLTIGGIYGKIIKTKEDRLTIEVGSDKTRFEVTRWAVSQVLNAAPEIKKAEPESKKAEKEDHSAKSEKAAEIEAVIEGEEPKKSRTIVKKSLKKDDVAQ